MIIPIVRVRSTHPREEGIRILVDIVPWFIESGAVPVFMVTHAIWPSSRDICQD